MIDLTVQVQGFPMTLAISAWTESTVEVALERYAAEIVSVDTYLRDLNGPKSGEDKSALIRVKLKGRPPVIVETTSDDLYTAIDRSARRIREAVKRSITKNRQLERVHASRPAGSFAPAHVACI